MDNNSPNIDWEGELAALLSELSSVQEELLEVLVQKRNLMIESDLDGMSQLQPREDSVAQRLQACHQRRSLLLQRAAEQGLVADNIRQLAASVGHSNRQQFGKQLQDVSARMRLLQHQGLTNWVLAQRTLLHLSQMLEIIATGGQLQPTYGKGDSAHARGSLVDRAA